MNDNKRILRKMMNKNSKAFTLMEIIIVVIISTIIIAFSVVQYQKGAQRVRERDAATQLMAIHSVNILHRVQTGAYLQTGGDTKDLAFINTNFRISIFENGLIYGYSSNNANSYWAEAEYRNSGGGTVFKIKITQDDISSTNPQCSGGTCLVY